ncbi:hypothetical protein E2562_011264 [Oryza meyeriana var. granulata]|uniref:E2F transcription factor CC-MB domain-containing protein n=1 Tax=Oryza meyeriana var. granulata TaxID=110450 RepID=A0A6G1BU49_9ORYZ|nr:hypothetical protein E2562_011264 [Oryza meyeriana var. granulata]
MSGGGRAPAAQHVVQSVQRLVPLPPARMRVAAPGDYHRFPLPPSPAAAAAAARSRRGLSSGQRGSDDSGTNFDGNISCLQTEVENLDIQEQALDRSIRWLFVTEDDIKGLPCFQNEVLVTIKGPRGTTLEVPDPDEAGDYPQRRYRILLRSKMGPIDLYLVSQYKKMEELGETATPTRHASVAEPPSIATEAGQNSEQNMLLHVQQDIQNTLELHASHAFGGMKKITPSDVDTDADYWLLTDEMQWDQMDTNDFLAEEISETQPPAAASEPTAVGFKPSTMDNQ